MAAPILWTPGENAFFLQENLHVHKIPRFGRGGNFGFWGGGSSDFIFMGAGIYLTIEKKKDRKRQSDEVHRFMATKPLEATLPFRGTRLIKEIEWYQGLTA